MKAFLLIIILLIFFAPQLVSAEQIFGQQAAFNIESAYDLDKRSQLTATLVKVSPQLYWYADNGWWSAFSPGDQEKILANLNVLTEEFEENAYPVLTRTFGSEWNPGIDKDARLTVLLHPMKKGAGGYSRTADEYPKIQSPDSNEREIIYLASGAIGSPFAKIFLAHEFTHLITFNQKEKILGIAEDTWLNEARSEYASTLLGYDKDYEGSNIQQRVKDFSDNPFDSLTEWRETAADYGVDNLFTQYLVEHYGVNILTESLRVRKSGVASINEVLAKAGFQTDFSQIFLDWTIAALVNDCSLAEKYCYLSPVLKNFRVTPLINYLPFSGDSTLSINNTAKDWAGNWYKFVGGQGKLRLEFQADPKINFVVIYTLEDSQGRIIINNLKFDQNNKGVINVADFGSKNTSLVIIPVARNKISDFTKNEPTRAFFLSASIINSGQENAVTIGEEIDRPAGAVEKAEIAREALIAELKAKIFVIQLEIVRLLQELIGLLRQQLLTA